MTRLLVVAVSGILVLITGCSGVRSIELDYTPGDESSIPVGEQSTPIDWARRSPQVLLGIRAGLNRNYHSGGFRSIDGPSCPLFESGSGNGLLGGLTGEFPVGADAGIVAALTAESKPGSFAQQLEPVRMLLDGADIVQTASMTSEITYRTVSAEVMYSHRIPLPTPLPRVSLCAGPVLSYVVDGVVEQHMDLDTPSNARLLPQPGATLTHGGRRLTFEEGAIRGLNAMRFSLKAGAQLEIGLFGNDVVFYPGIFYDFGLTDVTGNENWRQNSIVVQFDFRRAF